MNFKQRSQQAELMDSEQVSFEEFNGCLHDLRIINQWTLAYRPTIMWLESMMWGQRGPVTIMDIGCGGGDMLRRIAVWAKKRGIEVKLVGVDLNPWSKLSAESTTPPDMPIRYETADIFAFDPSKKADFIISSLFTHHLSDTQIPDFVRWMELHATQGWFINDLHRHRLPCFLIRHAVRILRFNRLVRHDAPVSVMRAFTASDWRHLLAQAGVPMRRVSLRWYMPFRYGVGCGL